MFGGRVRGGQAHDCMVRVHGSDAWCRYIVWVHCEGKGLGRGMQESDAEI
jgi:hypothetical protein